MVQKLDGFQKATTIHSSQIFSACESYKLHSELLISPNSAAVEKNALRSTYFGVYCMLRNIESCSNRKLNIHKYLQLDYWESRVVAIGELSQTPIKMCVHAGIESVTKAPYCQRNNC